jgi:hypothetical protein
MIQKVFYKTDTESQQNVLGDFRARDNNTYELTIAISQKPSLQSQHIPPSLRDTPTTHQTAPL